MKKRLGTLLLFVGIAVAPLYFSVPPAQAQQDEMQRAYNTGYQNGVNDARRSRPMNMNTGDWHGDRLTSYQKGYREGYDSAAGIHGDHDRDNHFADPEAQRAFQTGYDNGLRDAQRNHAMNPKTDDWHGDRLQAYQQGYEQGYRSAEHR
jgi:ribosome modulation factor